MASVREWSGYTKFFAFVMIAAGIAEVVFSFIWTGGYSYGWSAMAVGILYVCCGVSGFRAGIAKQLAAARQYFRILIVTAVVLSVMEIVYLALTNVFVDAVYNDCDYYSSCDLVMDTFRLSLLISGFISLGITLVCCACCIGCAKSYVDALEHENCHGEYTTVSPTPVVYQATAYPAYPTYPPQPAYDQPIYNQQAPHYTAPTYPQAPYGAPNAYQHQNVYPTNTYQPNAHTYQSAYPQNTYQQSNAYQQPTSYQPDASNKV